MICATIGRGRHSSLLAEWQAAAEAGADLVELRIDCLRSTLNFKRLLAERFTPVIFTVRRGADGGLWRADEEKRQLLIREAIVHGVDYVDLELDIAKAIPRFGKTKRVISYHNLKKTPENLEDIVRQMEELDPDVVKFAVLANSYADVSQVAKIAAEGKAPTVGIAMGELGILTRILARKFGAPFTYAGFNPDRVFAPGMLHFREMKQDYGAGQINPATEVYAVIGDPIQQSLSPAVHNAGFRHLGLNKVMVPLLVRAGQVEMTLDELAWLNLKGFSVTIPHKQAIVALLDQAEMAVERTGSCNTVLVQDGQWIGHNTDYRAAMDSLEHALGGRSDPEVSPLIDKQVLILGAGGVARAIAYGLMRRGAGVSVTSRTPERTNELAEAVGCRTVEWSARASTVCDILINCTPVGMHPDVDDTPMPPAGFRPGMVVFDTVYHPENTIFLKLARERGCQTISGVEMFLRQAAQQFTLYTGREAPVDLMRDTLKRKLSPLKE